MAGFFVFARKLLPGWSGALIIVCAGSLVAELGMWIATIVFPQ